eukprot:SM000023S07716  [mRNA]  locus=s23:1087880:1088455:- [translate_table: standard]
MKRRMQLGLLQDVYCRREKLDASAVAFLFRGVRVAAAATPDELAMEDADALELESDLAMRSDLLGKPFSHSTLRPCEKHLLTVSWQLFSS